MRRLKKELWPVKITVDKPESTDDIYYWLGDHLGVFKGRWNAVYQHNCTDFYFRNEKDAVLFSLRWAQ